MWPYIGMGVVAVVLIIGIVYNIQRSRKINQNGIETDAVISRIKEKEEVDADQNVTTSYEYFVTYKNETGETVEAQLGNPPRLATEGSQLRIKYLPEKPKYVRAVKK